MKKIIAFSFLLISLTAHGQDDRRKKDSIALFAPTGKGLPDGEPVSEKIGINGGRLISSDKKVEIIIPAGALASETMISIQPVSNLCKSGIGKTYHFEPSGLKFLVPAKLVFHYTDKDTADGSPQLMSVSTQDAKGSWWRLPNVKVDTELKTVTGTTMHFSGYVMSWAIVMWAHRNRVKVDNEVGVQLYVTPYNRSLDDVSLSVKEFIGAYKEWFGHPKEYPRIWSVNGILRGDGTVGKIIDIKDEYNVIYKAPVKVPDWNPVDIQIEVKGIEFEGRFINVIRKCRVRVYEHEYEVTMVHTMDAPGGTTLGKCIYRDRGSFVVSLDGKETKIMEIVNTNVEWDYKGKCIVKQLKSGSGSIHIAGVQGIIVIPAKSPTQPATVQIQFIRVPATIWPLLQFDCPQLGKKGGRYVSTTAMATAMGSMAPVLPMQIKFEAIEGEQTIVKMGEEGGKYFLKFTVKQLKDDE